MNPSFTLAKRFCSSFWGLLSVTFVKSNYLCIKQCHYANNANSNCCYCAAFVRNSVKSSSLSIDPSFSLHSFYS